MNKKSLLGMEFGLWKVIGDIAFLIEDFDNEENEN